MRKLFVGAVCVAFFLCEASSVRALTPTLSYSPATVMQGDPFIVRVENVATSSIKKLTFAGKATSVFAYHGQLTALVGVALNQKPGTYALALTLTNGKVVTKNVIVSARPVVQETLGIPAKLGGNTAQSQTAMVVALVQENKTLANIKTADKALWKNAFAFPLTTVVVTDPYGYSRQTGAYSIPHKGVDYKAPVGTPVMAVNAGIVRVVKKYTDYGNTIVVDHGLGVMSFYLHLSQMNVKVGDTVTQGQVIGLSGETGYAEGPHLHLSVRVNNVSIDPVKFFALF